MLRVLFLFGGGSFLYVFFSCFFIMSLHVTCLWFFTDLIWFDSMDLCFCWFIDWFWWLFFFCFWFLCILIRYIYWLFSDLLELYAFQCGGARPLCFFGVFWCFLYWFWLDLFIDYFGLLGFAGFVCFSNVVGASLNVFFWYFLYCFWFFVLIIFGFGGFEFEVCKNLLRLWILIDKV